VEPEHPLFALQRLDLEVRGLEEEHRDLLEREAIGNCVAELAQLELRCEDADARSAALADKIEALERETTPIAERIRIEEEKLYSGTMTAAKELEALQEEIRTLSERKEGLEEEELALMEQQEAIVAELRAVGELREALGLRRAELETRLSEREAEIEAALEEKRSERKPLGEDIAPKLLGAYERLRGQRSLAGQVVTPLKGRNCGRCGLAVREMALTALRFGDDTVHCDGCGRILLDNGASDG
jgi:predicted  nucleic acid-binding Zn-ribbon protein